MLIWTTREVISAPLVHVQVVWWDGNLWSSENLPQSSLMAINFFCCWPHETYDIQLPLAINWHQVGGEVFVLVGRPPLRFRRTCSNNVRHDFASKVGKFSKYWPFSSLFIAIVGLHLRFWLLEKMAIPCHYLGAASDVIHGDVTPILALSLAVSVSRKQLGDPPSTFSGKLMRRREMGTFEQTKNPSNKGWTNWNNEGRQRHKIKGCRPNTKRRRADLNILGGIKLKCTLRTMTRHALILRRLSLDIGSIYSRSKHEKI